MRCLPPQQSAVEFFARWCFYCKTQHEGAEALRKHVGTAHADSIRETNYLAAEA